MSSHRSLTTADNSRGRRRTKEWTNKSVRAFAGDADPVEAITSQARALVLSALDTGWSGPPFDPFALAELLGIEVTANSEVRDARLVPLARRKTRIEFNPNRPRGRIRYSIAHEIAHTLFPDFGDRIRDRAERSDTRADEWQLEALCNIAAAELLMPFGWLRPPPAEELSIHAVLDMQRQLDVSTEALMIRLAETSDEPLAAFCASPRKTEDLRSYQIDYTIPSRSWDATFPRSILLPPDSVVRDCTAIGFSARGTETWWHDLGAAGIEAVAIPPYPGGVAPRVVGLLRPLAHVPRPARCMNYVYGNATRPRGEGKRLIVHVVNDKTPNWGGGGFASALRSVWPEVQRDFQDWVQHKKAAYHLGNMRVSRVDADISVASLIAQHGYGPSKKARLRYGALRDSLAEVARLASRTGATVHMPRIGAGQAGGKWSVIQELIADTICAAGVSVTIYDLPNSRGPVEAQTSLSFSTFEDDGNS